MTTKNRRAVGTLGLAAVIAVLTVSMIAMNFTSNPAIGEQQGANKVGTAVAETSFLIPGDPKVIIGYEGKASDKHDVISRVTLECTTNTEVKATSNKKGGKDTDTASVGAVVWFTYTGEDGVDRLIDPYGDIQYGEVWDGEVPDDSTYLWRVCGQEMELQVNLNPIIVEVDGQLVFKCDTLDNPLTEDECNQWVQIFLSSWGTHTAVTLINDVPHGDYYVKVWGDTSLKNSKVLAPADDRTEIIIGKKFLENTPILMDNPST